MYEKIRSARGANLMRRSVKGQTIVFVALLLGLGVLIGLVAIAFDGGSALLQRRAMQNGADAGSQAGVDYMAEMLLINCAGGTCRPTYGITNAQLRARVEQFVAANRGGTVGTPVYSTTIEYHYMAGALVGSPPRAPCADCYMVAPLNDGIMPQYIDGLRVTAIINNPTTFAGAIPNPISDIRVSAVAAARLFPTCAPAPSVEDPTVPMTRLRPALEWQISQAGEDNTYCNPFLFWQSLSDLGGRARNFMNVVSFNTASFYSGTGISNPNNCTGGEQQLLTDFDCRNGASPPAPPPLGGGLLNHTTATGWSPFLSENPLLYNVCTAEPCADLRGSGQSTGSPMQTDLENWLAWQWRGKISVENIYPAASMTWYPSVATSQNDFGRGGQSPQRRPGDWAEAFQGNLGNNVNDSLTDSAAFFGRETEFSPSVAQGGLGWGKAVFTTVYVWGMPQLPNMNCSGGFPYCDDTSVQESTSYTRPIGGGEFETVNGWEDLEIRGSGNSYQARVIGLLGSELRVRFTKAYSVVFYQNLQGSCGGCIPFPGCGNLPNPSSSEVYGFILNQRVSDPPPPGSGCPTGWNLGDGVYTRWVAP